LQTSALPLGYRAGPPLKWLTKLILAPLRTFIFEAKF